MGHSSAAACGASIVQEPIPEAPARQRESSYYERTIRNAGWLDRADSASVRWVDSFALKDFRYGKIFVLITHVLRDNGLTEEHMRFYRMLVQALDRTGDQYLDVSQVGSTGTLAPVSGGSESWVDPNIWMQGSIPQGRISIGSLQVGAAISVSPCSSLYLGGKEIVAGIALLEEE